MPVIQITAHLWAEVTRQLRAGRHVRARVAKSWQSNVDQLVTDHMGLAERIARQTWRRFTRAGQSGYSTRLELQDFVSCAYIGLVEAARRYDPENGPFHRYAFLRIRGAIIERYRRANYRDLLHYSFDDAMAELAEESSAGTRGHSGAVGIAAEVSHALRDPAPAADERVARKEMRREVERLAYRILDDDEMHIVRQCLAGVSMADAAAACGHGAGWARAKLATARDKCAAAIQRVA